MSASCPEGVLWRLTVKGGTERDLTNLLGQELLKDLRVRDQISEMAGTMRSDLKNVLLKTVDELDRLKHTISQDQTDLAEICAAMGLVSGTTQIAKDSGHAVVEKELAEHLRQFILPTTVKKHEIIVSPACLPLVERLLQKRLSSRRQPKIADKQRVKLDEREHVLATFKLSLADKFTKKSAQREKIEAMLSKPPSDLSLFDTVSLLSFESRKTKSTGIGANYKYKVNMIRIKVEPETSISLSPPIGSACEWDDQGVDKECSTSSSGRLHNDNPDEYLELSRNTFVEFTSKLQQVYEISVPPEDLCDLFMTCCHPVSDAENVETESACDSGVEDGEVEPGQADGKPCVLKIIKRLGHDEYRGGGRGKFRSYWLSSISTFINEVLDPYLDSIPRPFRFEGTDIPVEAVDALHKVLSDAVIGCFATKALNLYFITRAGEDKRYRAMSRLVISKLSQNLVPTLRDRLAFDRRLVGETVNSLKQSLVRKAEVALRSTVEPFLDEAWQKVNEDQAWQKVNDLKEKSFYEPTCKASQPLFRSRRANDKNRITFATWMRRPTNQAENRATYQLKTKNEQLVYTAHICALLFVFHRASPECTAAQSSFFHLLQFDAMVGSF
eukprot:TRINITY_DN24827_c0_g1_i1.p1 TRINITY_DN24827_c0_g1~~TRINITY_DN24827_c0_g1_i1.p1  ORF type:complete len:613 (+),score=66.45 TRINITY_DN24827_c0_g1_i1:51-1889(+)